MTHTNRSPSPHHDRSQSPGAVARAIARNMDVGENASLVLGVAAAVLTADQLAKLTGSQKHKAAHLAKAGLGAAVTYGAYRMFRREREEKEELDRDLGDRGPYEEKQRSRPAGEVHGHSHSPPEKWALVERGRDGDGNSNMDEWEEEMRPRRHSTEAGRRAREWERASDGYSERRRRHSETRHGYDE